MLIMAGRTKLAHNKFYHALEHEHKVESQSGKPKRSWFKFWTKSRYEYPVLDLTSNQLYTCVCAISAVLFPMH